jgi:DNA-binding response OmpR family regulator
MQPQRVCHDTLPRLISFSLDVSHLGARPCKDRWFSPGGLLRRVRLVLRRIQRTRQKQAWLARSSDSRQHALDRHRQDIRLRERRFVLLPPILAIV